MMIIKEQRIGVCGSGAMGNGIAQVAAAAGHQVIVYDNNTAALEKAKKNLEAGINKLTEKNKLSLEEAKHLLERVQYTAELSTLSPCALIIEAIIENLEIKQHLFRELEQLCTDTCLLASNTSSLSITSIAGVCKNSSRVLGLHFFNPAPLMPLVEIIPGVATHPEYIEMCKQLMESWGKTPVICKDTPGFIVNRIARPYYGEALKIFEEGIADAPTIDWAMKELGGFKMGPFELMDLIGHDINYTVTETVWKQFYFDPRYKPSITQKRLVEANFLGRKSGQGFYQYASDSVSPAPKKDVHLGEQIFLRIVCMLINEAYDALYLKVAEKRDIETAMTKGVNYPKGLFQWAQEIGPEKVLLQLEELRAWYTEERYKPSVLLKKTVLKVN